MKKEFQNKSNSKIPLLRDTWFIPVLDKVHAYLKKTFIGWYVNYEDVTYNHVFCGYTVSEKNGKTYSLIIVGKKLHNKLDIFEELK